MIWLWIAAALVSAGLSALVVQRAARAAAAPAGDNPALAVYRRQMGELDDLADRGLLAEGERRAVRAETGRRLLAAAGREQTPLRASHPGVVLAAATAAPLLALAIYIGVGAPGLPDQPFAVRLGAWRAGDPDTLSAPQMAAILSQITKERPADTNARRALALAELASGQPLEAAQAAQRAISLDPRRADLWEILGEADAMAADGDIDADAQAAFQKALALDPTSAAARYALARAKIAHGDVAGGLSDWRAIEASLATDDPRRDTLGREIAEVSAHGRLPLAGPTAGPAGGGQPAVGPAQIQAMVDGLAAQLKANPDDADGWVRLVRAYGVLGETDRRNAALAEARRRYAERADVLQALAAAASAPAPQTAAGR